MIQLHRGDENVRMQVTSNMLLIL